MPDRPLSTDDTLVVVGCSLAGLRAAESARSAGFTGRVVLVGAEARLPYDRPPLSKQFLAGQWDEVRIALVRDTAQFEAAGFELRLGQAAVALDTGARRLELDDGSHLAFDTAVIATGSTPRVLPGTEAVPAVFTLRTLEDSLALRRALTERASPRLVVVGAGFIGSEVAATAAALGARVTVVEPLPVPLARVLGDEVGAACASLHEAHGVSLRLGVGVTSIGVGAGGPEVSLTDGTILVADVVVVGIGVAPETGWLESSGLDVDDGVTADETLHAADGIVVAGDLARWWEPRLGETLRVEHWTNAAESGLAAGRSAVAGRSAAPSYSPIPYVWSDQHGVKIQVIGWPRPTDEVVVVDGEPTEHRFVALYNHDSRLSAAVSFSRPRQLMAYRPLLDAGASFDEALALSPA